MKSYFVLLRNPLRLLIMLFAITLASINVHAESDHDEEHEKEHAEKQGEKHDEEGLIALSAEQLSNAGIELAQAGAVKIRETLPLYGVVALNTERMQRISARFPGVIHTVSRQVGDLVQPGDVLATVESDESLKSYSLTAAIRGVVTERHANVGENQRCAFVCDCRFIHRMGRAISVSSRCIEGADRAKRSCLSNVSTVIFSGKTFLSSASC